MDKIRDKHVAKISKKSHQWAVCAFDNNTWPCDTKKVLDHLDEVVKGFNDALEVATSLLATDCNEDAYSDWVDKTDFSVIWDYLPYAESEMIDAVQKINAGEDG